MKLNFKFLAKSPDLNLSVESPVEQWTVPHNLEAPLKAVVQTLDHLDPQPDNGSIDLTQKVVLPVKFRWLFFTFNKNVEIDVTVQVGHS